MHCATRYTIMIGIYPLHGTIISVRYPLLKLSFFIALILLDLWPPYAHCLCSFKNQIFTSDFNRKFYL